LPAFAGRRILNAPCGSVFARRFAPVRDMVCLRWGRVDCIPPLPAFAGRRILNAPCGSVFARRFAPVRDMVAQAKKNLPGLFAVTGRAWGIVLV
jgi:hypothetical protein